MILSYFLYACMLTCPSDSLNILESIQMYESALEYIKKDSGYIEKVDSCIYVATYLTPISLAMFSEELYETNYVPKDTMKNKLDFYVQLLKEDIIRESECIDLVQPFVYNGSPYCRYILIFSKQHGNILRADLVETMKYDIVRRTKKENYNSILQNAHAHTEYCFIFSDSTGLVLEVFKRECIH